MDKFFIVDGNSLINRAFYATPLLKNSEGTPTNAIYGFSNMLIKILMEEKPKYMAVAFDLKAPTFRHKMYTEYKAGRHAMPDELGEQIPLLKELLACMDITTISREGFEADDILGTMSKKINAKTIILSGDRDALQLVSDSTEVWLTKKGISELQKNTMDTFFEFQGIKEPRGIIELKSLMGDSSDNIPGVKGIGEKTALNLITEYGTLDKVYENIDNFKGKMKENLVTYKENAYLSHTLATIDCNMELDIKEEDLTYTFPFSNKVYEFFEKMQFNKLLSRAEIFSNDLKIEEKKDERVNKEITSKTDLDEIIAEIKEKQIFSFIVNNNVQVAVDNINYTLKVVEGFLEEGFSLDEIFKTFKDFFEDDKIKKVVFDAKNLMHILKGYDITLSDNFEDVAVIKYLKNSSKAISTLDKYIKTNLIDINFLALEFLNDYKKDIDTLKEQELFDLYKNVELKLEKVLFDMEVNGFKIDIDNLNKLAERYRQEQEILQEEIYKSVGERFNVNSPKQLADILFNKLELKVGKKKPTSTSIDVLESLIDKHEVIKLVIRYRSISKLKSTYLDGFKPLIDANNKVHTRFFQTMTATGRLSSQEPNLQNIPIREKEGEYIRELFVASDTDRVLVSADYSQIELRLLAHYSRDEKLVYAYNNDIDIHTQTASEVFGVSLNDVTPHMRKMAKMVNFGIIYGISDFGLARNLGIPVWEARDYIKKYFETYTGVKTFMDSSVETARKQGYITTLFNRRRYIDELKSSNYLIRSQGERIAKNMPLQGTSADMIKIAMLNVFDRLKDNKMQSRMILQIHDELIVDAFKTEVEEVKNILKDEMEKVIKLSVPLVVNVGVGYNLLETK